MQKIDIVARAHWPELAAFIHRHNRRSDGRARCLHAEHGDTADAQASEMLAIPDGEACFVAARAGTGGEWSGTAGCELDPALGRAWLRGPLTRDADDAALQVALIHALEAALPRAVRRFDAFPQVSETALRASYRAAGYRDHMQHHVFCLERPQAPPPWPEAVAAQATPAAAELAARLHEQLFPDTYLTRTSMLESLDDEHRLFAAEVGGTVAGYVYVQDKPLEDEGYIDFIGVSAEARGRGLGRALLDAAVHWAMVERGRPRVSLTARQDRTPALGLYEAAGFREVAAGAHMIKVRTA